MKKGLMLGFIIFCHLAYADEAAKNRLASVLNATTSLSATFSQTVRSGGRLIDRSEGLFFMHKPGMFRLDIKKPNEQLIVSDGKTLWIFDKALEQVTQKKLQKGLTNTPALFLSDTTHSALNRYNIRFKQQNDLEQFLLVPLGHETDYQYIQLFFKAHVLQGLTIKDNLEQTTSLELSHVKSNPKLPTRLFGFTPPKGVDVVTE